MPDYIYLLKNRLSIHQRNALDQICEAAREAGMTVFLVGGAVRDLTSGSSVNDLDVAVQGDALKLKKPLEKSGAILWGEHTPSRTLFFRFPVGVTVEISSTRHEEYPKPGKPVYVWDTILDDLRRRDFTANAMALSLNEHSYGLLMDPLNGVADIEARQLRLVSNYGFIEDPARLLRATRLAARLGWEMDERTKTRFENAKESQAIEALSTFSRGYELEEIAHEEDGFKVLSAMESEGWMQHLMPAWTTSAADTAGLEEMRKLATQLQVQGVNPDISAASAHFLTAKLPAKDLAALKAAFVRPGFVQEWNNLDHAAKEFSKELTGKEAAKPSATWKLFMSADPQAVLWLGLTSKVPAVQAKYKSFFTVWPEARQKIPYALLQEMRITPEVPGYDEMMSLLFLGVIDGELETDEQLRAFLEPYSPPAPPPPVTVRRSRGSRKSAESKKAAAESDMDGEISEVEPLDLDEDAGSESGEDADADAELDDEESEPPVVAPPPPKKAPAAAAKAAHKEAPPAEKPAHKAEAAAHHPEPAKTSKVQSAAKHVAKPAPAKEPAHSPARANHHPAKPAHAAAPTHAPARKAPAKAVPAKVAAKPAKAAPSKAAGRVAAKPVAAKPAAKNNHAPKKAHAKPAVKVHKKAEPAKKSAPAKKAVPAKKHR
jgi:tRNA nucleotidyltransferase (CCA-adding enzyme)